VVYFMLTVKRLAIVEPATLISQALALMAKTRNGAAVIADASGKLSGIFTHGDFGRVILKHPQAVTDPISKHMTSPCKYIHDDALVMDAYEMMHEKFNALPVVDAEMKVLGLLDIQDLV
jgi:arabinose-5-phosphate isomerase